MKLKLVYLGLAVVLVIGVAVYRAYSVGKAPAETPPSFTPSMTPEQIHNAKYVQDGFVYGDSMEPALHNNQIMSFDSSVVPKVDDIVIFSCTGYCNDGGNLTNYSFAKRIIKIDSRGCYWLQGDNDKESFDSRSYGWLCPPDIKILGVVVKTY